MLPIAMLTGASVYLIYHAMPEPVHIIGPVLSAIVGVIQPLLIFLMLFFTFCGIEPRQLKPHRWHWWLLLIQGGTFIMLGCAAWAVLRWMPGTSLVLIESAMLCFICPAATAAAVVTRKLGGDVPGITTYIVLINILTAVLVPIVVPMIRPEIGVSFGTAFCMILAKVFPLLITPCLCASVPVTIMRILLRTHLFQRSNPLIIKRFIFQQKRMVYPFRDIHHIFHYRFSNPNHICPYFCYKEIVVDNLIPRTKLLLFLHICKYNQFSSLFLPILFPISFLLFSAIIPLSITLHIR